MTIEVVAPEAILIQTNLSGTISAVQDDPDTIDESWLTANNSENTILRASFKSPTYNLNVGPSLQNFKVFLRRTNNSTRVPTVTIELFEQGSLKTTLVSALALNSTTGELLSYTWDALNLDTLSGENVEIQISGVVSDGPQLEKNTIEIGAIFWSADVNVPAGIWIEQDNQNNSWVTMSSEANALWNSSSNEADQWNLRSAAEITDVIIENTRSALTSIVWNAYDGTATATIDPPYIEGGVPPYSYEWQIKNGSALMEHAELFADSLSLSYQASPLQSEHDIAVEGWAVLVTDNQRSRYLSNICEVELDLYRETMPIADVSISASEYNYKNITWNAASGTSNIIITAPVITGGFGPLTYSWQRLSGDQLIIEDVTNNPTLNLSYTDSPSQDQTLSATETWALTVSDGYGSTLQSNACNVTLDLYRATEPVSVVAITSTLSNTKNMLWDDVDGTATVSIAAPVVTGGFGALSYQWNRISVDGDIIEAVTTNSTLDLSYTANPNEGAELSASETWSVTVTDSKGSTLASNNCVVSLDVARPWSPITDVTIQSTASDVDNISWNVIGGTTNVVIAAPVITNGRAPYSYEWNRVSADSAMVEGSTTGSTLALTYEADPAEGATLTAAETWAVTVTDFNGAFLTSGNVVVTLDIIKATEPISAVVIQSTLTNTANIAWDALNGTANVTIAAPVVTGGFGALSYQWNRISADGAIVEGLTTNSTLDLSYTANPSEGESLPVSETWAVTVTDSRGSVLASNNSVVTLDVARAWSPITNVSVTGTMSDLTTILWDGVDGTSNVVIAAPVVTNGRAPYTYQWNRVSVDGAIIEGVTTNSTLSLSYTDAPLENQTLQASETWSVTVTDFNGALLTSGNCVVSLGIYREWSPITVVSIQATAENSSNITWDAVNGTANVSIAAPTITNGRAPYTYQWNRISADGAIVEGLTTNSTLDLSYTASPSEGGFLSASETWSVTVTDFNGAFLASNNSVVTLDVARAWSPITGVSIQATADDSASILWDVVSGTASVVISAPIITNGRAPYTYQWNKISADGLMTNGSTTASTLALSYTADPLEDQTLASSETWTVTVTDFNGASLTSANVVASLDVYRGTEPISVVAIAATATNTSNILWSDVDGTASATISAPTITGGVAPYSYQWNLESSDGSMTNGSTVGDSLTFSYTAAPAEGASLSSTETWSVTVTDSKSSSMTSGNSIVTLDVTRAWSPITNVAIASTATDATNIAWDDVNGTASVVIGAPTISNGRAPYTYLWSKVSIDSAMTNGSITASTLSLSLTADPTESATLSSAETWKVTVTDANGMSLASNNVVATLDVTRATRPITAVTIAATAINTDVIAWNASSGTASAAIAAPSVTGGFGALTYAWSRVSVNGSMTNSSASGSSLTLSYTANPGQGATLSSTETWKVTVSDGYGSSLASANCVVTLDIDKGTQPISAVTIASTATATQNITWNAANGTATKVIAAPTVTGGYGALTYVWSLVSANGTMTNSSTTGSSLTLSYTANPANNSTLSSTETWKVTVSDGYGASLASGNCVVTLYVDRAAEPISSVTLVTPKTVTVSSTSSSQSKTASWTLVATVNGGTGPFTYLWSLVSGTGLVNTSTTASTLILSKTGTAGASSYNSGTETWKVTVTDVSGSVVSNNAVITCRIYGNYSTGGTSTSCLMSIAEVSIIGNTSNSGIICTLADVEVGDQIVSFNTPTMIDESSPNWREWLESDITDGEVGTTTVVRADPSTAPVHYVINGLLKSTRRHPYMVLRQSQWQWINAEDLSVGDCLYGMDGSEIPITSLEFVTEAIDIVNIGAETTDTFFAGSLNGQLILNHNK